MTRFVAVPASSTAVGRPAMRVTNEAIASRASASERPRLVRECQVWKSSHL